MEDRCAEFAVGLNSGRRGGAHKVGRLYCYIFL